MKALTVLLISVSLLPAAVQARSNAEPVKPLNNPIYSVNNYKQPHLTTASTNWNSTEVVWVNKVTASTTPIVNYKSQLAADHPSGSIIYNPHNELINWSYKTPHDLQSKGAEGEFHVRKHHNHSTVGH
ncbi:hypothetical protein GO755_23020 [Spirosoma sp. HMF4905]|uniref:Uncharacterized protein n=1 Tax=Spirosoma arboris TaxID=2682092 RepID=A0A7K1SGL1_9BACT|nr:hypothetical protein [Spirosoma arboris]MVM32931.1 hypothetical protein [Spirosoma arboris]